MKLTRRMLALVLCLLLLGSLAAAAAAEDVPYSLTLRLGAGSIQVRAFCDSFANNVFLSLSDLSAALSGTDRQFSFSYDYTAADGEFFTVTTGQASGGVTGGVEGSAAYVTTLSPRRNRLFRDGRELKYYTHRYGSDLYMSLVDVQLLLDVSIEPQADGSLRLEPRSFAPTPGELYESGFLDAVSAVVLGDAATGELLYDYHGGEVLPVASLSKLMGYLLIAEAVNSGRIGLNDLVPVSAKAAALSRSPDGMVELHEGTRVPLTQLLDAMLLASSNESALALAEYVSGSEEAFVAAMNAKAASLGLHHTVFRSPHGLPVYTAAGLPAKQQNVMTGEELFSLCRTLLASYPALTGRTAQQYAVMPALNYVSANSNPMVFNVPGVNGLKTGNTTRAGYCLISTLPVTAGSETHTLVLIVLGAESAALRNQVSQILLLYAQRRCLEGGF